MGKKRLKVGWPVSKSNCKWGAISNYRHFQGIVLIQCCPNSISNWGRKLVTLIASLIKVSERTALGKQTRGQTRRRELTLITDKVSSTWNKQHPRITSFPAHTSKDKKRRSLKKNMRWPWKAVTQRSLWSLWLTSSTYTHHAVQSQKMPSFMYRNWNRK